MSTSPEDNDFVAEFLDDYFAECDEHLAQVRHHLLSLESSVAAKQVDLALVNQLFRSFHTLKGLSGMVGVKEAEELAHELENYLRVLRDEQVVMEDAGFDALMGGAKLLDQVIACYRERQPPPDITALRKQIAQLIPPIAPLSPSTSAGQTPTGVSIQLKPEQKQQLEEIQTEGKSIWHFVFTPGQQLAQRGINVNQIRSRLENLGQIVHAAPRLTPTNDIVFDFIVALETPPSDLSQWQDDGVTCCDYHEDRKSETREAQTPVGIKGLPPAQGAEDSQTQDLHTPSSSPNLAPLITTAATVVRVELPKLDDLMRMVGELVISRARLADNINHVQNLDPYQKRSLQEINLTLERQLRSLREGVMRVRLVPIGEAFARMQFVVRDLVRESNKQVNLNISGQDTEIDKFVVERMIDPLLHLVRNAVSHGIESPQSRMGKGKSPTGTITLRAKTRGEIVEISVEDDGQGIDVKKVTEMGKIKGLISEEQEIINDPLVLLDIITNPGFSTREQADLTSGRGVGMAIVKNTVAELGGLLSLKTKPNQGTCYTIQLPLTLAIADALIIGIGGQKFAIPQSAVAEVTEIELTTEITQFEGQEMFSYRGSVLPLIRLGEIFRLGKKEQEQQNRLKLVIVGGTQHRVGLVVEQILGLREIVVRPLTDPFVQVLGIAGATELGDGRVVLILDVGSLIRSASQKKYQSHQQKISSNLPPDFRGARGDSSSPNAHDSRSSKSMIQQSSKSISFILFQLNNTNYAIPSDLVQQMEMIEQITPVPNAPPFVEGVVFSRGQVLPVISLRNLFGFEKIPYDLRTRLIVVKCQNRTVGLIVDTAREFVVIDAETIKPPPEEMNSNAAKYLAGIVTLNQRVVLILDLEVLLN